MNIDTIYKKFPREGVIIHSKYAHIGGVCITSYDDKYFYEDIERTLAAYIWMRKQARKNYNKNFPNLGIGYLHVHKGALEVTWMNKKYYEQFHHLIQHAWTQIIGEGRVAHYFFGSDAEPIDFIGGGQCQTH